MNDDNLLVLSTVLEGAFLLSLGVAALAVWARLRARRAARLKERRHP